MLARFNVMAKIYQFKIKAPMPLTPKDKGYWKIMETNNKNKQLVDKTVTEILKDLRKEGK